MQAKEFLEQLQRSSPPAPRAAEVMQDPEFIRGFLKRAGSIEDPDTFHRANLEILDSLARDSPTSLQDRAMYALVLSLSRRIERVLPDFSMSIGRKPLFGTLPTGRVNAIATSLGGNAECLVLFEDGLFLFSDQISAVVADSLSTTSPTGEGVEYSLEPARIEQVVDAHPAVVTRLGGILTSYLVHGRVSPVTRCPSYRQQALASMLNRSMLLFVMGHEYAHIVRGHLETGLSASVLIGSESFEMSNPSWENEHEADIIGFFLMARAMRALGLKAEQAFLGADLFLKSVGLLETAGSIIDPSFRIGDPDSTHPGAADRRAVLRKMVRQTFEDKSCAIALGLADAVGRTIEILFSRLEPSLQALREKGVDLAPVWLDARGPKDRRTGGAHPSEQSMNAREQK